MRLSRFVSPSSLLLFTSLISAATALYPQEQSFDLYTRDAFDGDGDHFHIHSRHDSDKDNLHLPARDHSDHELHAREVYLKGYAAGLSARDDQNRLTKRTRVNARCTSCGHSMVYETGPYIIYCPKCGAKMPYQ